MKYLSFVFVLIVSCSFMAGAQGRPGVKRDGGGNGNGDGGRDPNGRQTESRPVEYTPPPPPPSQPVHDYNPPPVHNPVGGICIVEPIITPPPTIIVTVVEKEEPEINEVVLHSNDVSPEKSGFDFSADEVVHSGSKSVDVHFAVSKDGAEFVVGKDADIQDFGRDFSFYKLESVPSREWSQSHRVRAELDNVYVVWTWDNQYYKFIMNSLSESRVAIEWMKMDVGARIAANDDVRNGKHHREVGDRFGR